MKDQDGKIKGYRDLSQEEIDLMNEVKSQGEIMARLVERLMQNESTDKRWVAIGKTDMQTGCMALVRSVAKPESF